MNGSAGLTIRQPKWHDGMRIAVNASRDVISHSFDPSKMESLLQQLIAEAVRYNVTFIPQTETLEIKVQIFRAPRPPRQQSASCNWSSPVPPRHCALPNGSATAFAPIGTSLNGTRT
jgi:hypothetical protein